MASAKILRIRRADEHHEVVTVQPERSLYRREPCATCPWRKDAVGEFPAEAFRLSADTAYDLSQKRFSCHESGTEKPATCAGFILRGADHNLSMRLAYVNGTVGDDVVDGGHELFDSYREMAIANGVAAEDPVLKPCR